MGTSGVGHGGLCVDPTAFAGQTFTSTFLGGLHSLRRATGADVRQANLFWGYTGEEARTGEEPRGGENVPVGVGEETLPVGDDVRVGEAIRRVLHEALSILSLEIKARGGDDILSGEDTLLVGDDARGGDSDWRNLHDSIDAPSTSSLGIETNAGEEVLAGEDALLVGDDVLCGDFVWRLGLGMQPAIATSTD